MKTIKSILPTAAVLAVSYGILEVVHHTLINGMLVPYLMTLALAPEVITGITIVIGLVSILALAYIVTRTVGWIKTVKDKTVTA